MTLFAFRPTVVQVDAGRRRHALLALFFIGTCWSFGYAIWQKAHAEEPYAEENDIAEHVVRGHGYSSPMDASANSPPTSWSAPIYPSLMAGVYRVFGIGSMASRIVLLLMNAMSCGGAAAALARLGMGLFDFKTGIVAGMLFLFHPVLLSGTLMFWDSELALCMFFWLMVFAQEWGVRGRMTRARAGIYGLGLGVLALTNPVYAAAYPLLVIVALRGGDWCWRSVCAACIVGAGVLVLTPWTVRNYHTFGRVFFVRGGGSFELWLGNTPGSHGLTEELLPFHPYLHPSEKREYLEAGETRYFEAKKVRFAAEYRKSPITFWRRCVRRAAYIVVGEPAKVHYALLPRLTWHGFGFGSILLNSVLGGLAVWGAWLSRRRWWLTMWVLLGGVLAVTPFVFSHVSDRYTFPLRAASLLYVAAVVVELLEGRAGKSRHAARLAGDAASRFA